MWLCVCGVLCVLQFDALQTCSGPSAPVRRPPCNTLLDVFENIRCAGLTPFQRAFHGPQLPCLRGWLRLTESELAWMEPAQRCQIGVGQICCCFPRLCCAAFWYACMHAGMMRLSTSRRCMPARTQHRLPATCARCATEVDHPEQQQQLWELPVASLQRTRQAVVAVRPSGRVLSAGNCARLGLPAGNGMRCRFRSCEAGCVCCRLVAGWYS
jgi:hypothetical protein